MSATGRGSGDAVAGGKVILDAYAKQVFEAHDENH
jgi:hypothetical protein